MMQTTFPPASPADAQRPATAADIASNEMTRLAWLDYLDMLHSRIARQCRTHRVARMARQEAVSHIVIRPPPGAPKATPTPPSGYGWESPIGPNDQRPTFAEALAAHMARTGISEHRVALLANVPRTTSNIVWRCAAIPTQETRMRLAAMLGMQPQDIRWPVPVKEVR